MQRHEKEDGKSETVSLAGEPFSSVPPEAMTSEEGAEWFVLSEGRRRRNPYPCVVSFNAESLDGDICIRSNSVCN